MQVGEVGEVGHEMGVDLAGEVALEAADGFGFGESFGFASLGVGLGGGVPAESAEGDVFLSSR